MNRTLIIGDLHLGKGLKLGTPGIGQQLNGRVADQFKLLDWILDQAIEYNVSHIIFTGDICENVKPDYYLLVYFISWIKKCDYNGITIDIVAGNHDIERSGSHYSSVLDLIQAAELSNVTVHKQITTIYNGMVGFTLLPFRDRRSLNLNSANEAIEYLKGLVKYELEEIPTTYDKVLIGHLALEGSLIIGDELDDISNELMCPIDMFNGYDYVWMGHIHRPQIRCKNPYVAHIGSLDISDFGEVDHTKIVILYDPQLPNKFQEISVPSRPLRYVKVEVNVGEDSTKLVLEHLEKADQNKSLIDSILRLEVQLHGLETGNVNRSLILDQIRKYGVHYLCNFSECRTTQVVPQEKRKDLNNTINPKAAVKIWADDNFKDDFSDREMFISIANDIIEQCKDN